MQRPGVVQWSRDQVRPELSDRAGGDVRHVLGNGRTAGKHRKSLFSRFGHSGGTGGVHERPPWRQVGRRLVPRGGGGELGKRVDYYRCGGTGLPGHGRGLRAGEDQPGRAVAQDVTSLSRAELPVHRHRRRAGVDHGQVRDRRLRAVLRKDRDPPVRAEVRAEQRVDYAVQPVVEFGPGQVLSAIR